ncbi:MAG: hypothetical protein ABL967_01745 [Bryobacteraceae bacterium]
MKNSLVIMCLLLSLLVCGQTPAHPDISGYWELSFDSSSVPPASLVQPLTSATEREQMRHDAEWTRYCVPLGMPYILSQSPLDIRQSPAVTAMVSKVPSSTRYVFTDGRKHPEKEDLEPTSNGHSTGQWEGDTFVVDTIGFNDRGVARLPGGGIRTPDSRLTERYRLMENGNRLSVTLTWEDRKTFQKPHTYEYRYYRIPKITGARVLPCDTGDQERATFLMAPFGN